MILILLSAIVVMTHCAPPSSNFQVPMLKLTKEGSPLTEGKISGQIVSGSAATLGQFPWQASLFMKKSNGYFLCGGSLIHPQWILTAGHCTSGIQAVQIRVGTLKFNDGAAITVVASPSTVITHEKYNSITLNNDLGLIKLPANAVTINSSVQTIGIASISTNFSQLAVSGWGRPCQACSTSQRLNHVSVDWLSNNACKSAYGSMITPNTLCTQGPTMQSTCSGDSGGPLIVPKTATSGAKLAGVVSFVHAKGCDVGLPAGYVRINNYNEWLKKNTGVTF